MRKTQEYLRKAAVPTEAERNAFFIGREGLLGVYAILKNVSEKKAFFPDEEKLVRFLQKYAAEFTDEKIIFALTVFEEIGLLEIQKNDRIHIVIRSGKRELSDSAVYQKFGSGEK